MTKVYRSIANVKMAGKYQPAVYMDRLTRVLRCLEKNMPHLASSILENEPGWLYRLLKDRGLRDDQIPMAKQLEPDLDIVPETLRQGVEQAKQLEREYHGGRSVGWLF